MEVIAVARIARGRRQRPWVVVGHVVEHQVAAQADAGAAQGRSERIEVGIVAQRRLDLVEAGDGETAVVFAAARAQEGQQVQVGHAQLAQVGDASGHAAQAAAKVGYVCAVAEHTGVGEPAGLAFAAGVLQVQRRRARRDQLPDRFHQVAQPGINAGRGAVQAGNAVGQNKAVPLIAFGRRSMKMDGHGGQHAVQWSVSRHLGLGPEQRWCGQKNAGARWLRRAPETPRRGQVIRTRTSGQA